MEKALAGLAGVAVFIGSIILEGFVLKVLWGWFVSGYFGIQELTIPVALGLALLVSMSTRQTQKEDADTVKVLSMGVWVPLVSLLMGWIIHLFM